ncbi:TetR/AcrR family transcriptional regulator [Bifidobacterium sp. ESL0800]|uniref:TetR/AcrR family transcriptional regulator n=1 Tax=Bifidobacterium sp. ESL0800 TaxID=2983236 RepID=UPI0023F64FAE|nr:TetR/AcrR family transcriptional regulator [Bifidobacterium sp. ESL0800]WEV75665.1 TetR/AcrR family transcriptional regulator [Bifidobacterium sp. ESL0800]
MSTVTVESKQADTLLHSGIEQAKSKRDQIVRAAQEMSLKKGFTHITIKDIANKVGMTRSLFYHYFKNKDAVAEAVLDEAVDRIIDRIDTWNETRQAGNVDKAMNDIVRLMRDILNDEGPFSQHLVESGNGELYIRFVDQVSQRVADYIEHTAAQDFARLHGGLPVRHLHETLAMLISGLIAILRAHPDTPDETIIEILAQTLHLESYRNSRGSRLDAPATGSQSSQPSSQPSQLSKRLKEQQEQSTTKERK